MRLDNMKSVKYIRPEPDRELTKLEATIAMLNGEKVRHLFFAIEEWVTINSNGLYEFEDGITTTPNQFWSVRKDLCWITGWFIYTENKMQ